MTDSPRLSLLNMSLSWRELGTKLIIPFCEDSGFTRILQNLGTQAMKHSNAGERKTLLIESRFIYYLTSCFQEFFKTLIWGDIVPDILYSAKKFGVRSPYFSLQHIKKILFSVPFDILGSIVITLPLKKKECDLLYKALLNRDSETTEEILSQLDSDDLCLEVGILEYFIDFDRYIQEGKFFKDILNENVEEIEDFKSNLYEIRDIVQISDAYKTNEILNFLFLNIGYTSIDSIIDEICNLVHLYKTYEKENIRKVAIQLYVFFFFLGRVCEHIYGKTHILIQYFPLIKRLSYYTEFERTFSSTEMNEIQKKINNIFQRQEAWKDEVSKLSPEITPKINIGKIDRLGMPDAFSYTNLKDKYNQFIEALYNEYGSMFPDLDSLGFHYCFGSSKTRPMNYPQLIKVNASKVDFLIFIRSLYRMGTTWTMSELFVLPKDFENGKKTDWTRGNPLKEETHGTRVSRILNIAEKFGLKFTGDGISWLKVEVQNKKEK